MPDSEAPGGERAKVLDFGIAKISDQQASGLTQMGEVMGTPRYMSPEQCKGSGQVDAKTDVALGIIMFILLTGKPPFDAEGTGALMAMHIYHEPPKLREVEPGFRRRSKSWCCRCWAKSLTSARRWPMWWRGSGSSVDRAWRRVRCQCCDCKTSSKPKCRCKCRWVGRWRRAAIRWCLTE